MQDLPEDEGLTIEPGDGVDVFFTDHVIVGRAETIMSDTKDGPDESMEILTMYVTYQTYTDEGELIPERKEVLLALNPHAEADLKLGIMREALGAFEEAADPLPGTPEQRAEKRETN